MFDAINASGDMVAGVAQKKTEQLDPRTESAIARTYLDLVVAPRKKAKGRRTPEWLETRIKEIQERLADGKLGGIERVELIQERMACEKDLADATDDGELAGAEMKFVEIAAAWAERKGISYAALREAGVPASVLKQAGISRAS